MAKLELNGPAENFLITLERKFKRCKKILDRNVHSVRFTVAQGADGGYCLGLEESDLIVDWESVVGWIKSKRDAKLPYLYAVIEADEI
jgi:hypothetical protein